LNAYEFAAARREFFRTKYFAGPGNVPKSDPTGMVNLTTSPSKSKNRPSRH